MNRTSFRRGFVPALAALTLSLGLSACGASNEGGGDTEAPAVEGLAGTLNGAGSSAQEAAQGAWRAAFQTANPDVTINYDPVGSGGGVEQFLAGGVAFAGSDSYLDDASLEASKEVCEGETALEVPNYISPIAVIYNLDGVDELQLDANTIAGIFAGEITNWNDPAIAETNPDAELPDLDITPVHRSDESGTTDNFTDYLFQAAGDVWTEEPDKVWPFKSGEAAAGTSGVVSAVGSGSGAIGYADASQAGDLGVATVKVGDEFVAPDAESAAAIADVSTRVEGRADNDLAIDVARSTDDASAYPVVLVSYLIACPTYADAETAELVKAYGSYIVGAEGQSASADAAGSAPISDSLSGDAVKVFEAISAK